MSTRLVEVGSNCLIGTHEPFVLPKSSGCSIPHTLTEEIVV